MLIVKTHEWGPNAWEHFGKAILLVRDPDKAIIAEFNRQSGGHVGFASPDRYKRTKGRCNFARKISIDSVNQKIFFLILDWQQFVTVGKLLFDLRKNFFSNFLPFNYRTNCGLGNK